LGALCLPIYKISDDFKNKLLVGAEEAKKENLDYTNKLAGIIKG
jgi:hypothetical protein